MNKVLSIALVALSVVAAGPALAHHPMGGVTPATFADGLLSGLGHPVIGLDHFAAVIAVGALAVRAPRRGRPRPSVSCWR